MTKYDRNLKRISESSINLRNVGIFSAQFASDAYYFPPSNTQMR